VPDLNDLLRIGGYEEVPAVEIYDDTDKLQRDFPVLAESAYYGLAGDFVKTVDPYTEAARPAILLQTLTMFGIAAGKRAHFEVGGDEHPARLFTLIVGTTGEGRKGTSWGVVRKLFNGLVSLDDFVIGGFVSGEALVSRLQGEDKRGVAFEPEFGRVLTAMKWEGSTLSMRIRETWDGVPLRYESKKESLLAGDYHAALVGHITPEELRARLRDDDIFNGFANRFIFCLSDRSKEIWKPVGIPQNVLQPFRDRFAERLRIANTLRGASLFEGGEATFRDIVRSFATERTGSEMSHRARPYMLRIALTYALLDGVPTVTVDHLKAAEAVWRYNIDSIRYLFGSKAITGTEQAMALLRRVLADGPVKIADVSTIARAEGISAKMMRNAKERLGVIYRADTKSYELPTRMYVPQ